MNSDGDDLVDAHDNYPVGIQNTPRDLAFTIHYKDRAGNFGIPKNNSAVSSSVGVDTTIPQVLKVSIASDNSDNQTAKAGENVFLTFTTSESVRTPSTTDVTMGILTNVTISPLDSEGKVWKASGQVPSGSVGNVSFSITVQDHATPVSRKHQPPTRPPLHLTRSHRR